MPAKATIEFVQQSKIGTEVTGEQCVVLSGLLEELAFLDSRPRFAHQVLHRSGAQLTELTSYIYKTRAKY